MKKVSKTMAAKKPMMKKGGMVKKQKGGMSAMQKADIRARAYLIKNPILGPMNSTPTASEQNILMNDKNLAKNRANSAKVEANKRKVKENKQQVKVNAIKKKYKM